MMNVNVILFNNFETLDVFGPVEQDQEVRWVRKARWVNDGKYYTSSGVSAGIDMTLGFISDVIGLQIAEKIVKGIEYVWNNDKDNDPFCSQDISR